MNNYNFTEELNVRGLTENDVNIYLEKLTNKCVHVITRPIQIFSVVQGFIPFERTDVIPFKGFYILLGIMLCILCEVIGRFCIKVYRNILSTDMLKTNIKIGNPQRVLNIIDKANIAKRKGKLK